MERLSLTALRGNSIMLESVWQGYVLVHMIVSTQRGSKLYERTLRWLSYDNLWINYTRSHGCGPLGLKNRGSNQENQTKIKDSGLAPPTRPQPVFHRPPVRDTTAHLAPVG